MNVFELHAYLADQIAEGNGTIDVLIPSDRGWGLTFAEEMDVQEGVLGIKAYGPFLVIE